MFQWSIAAQSSGVPKPQLRLEDGLDDARTTLTMLSEAKISVYAVTSDLLADGLKKFTAAADTLYAAIASKRLG